MRTSMQSLLAHLKSIQSQVETVPVQSIVDLIEESYLQKEEQQIIDACNSILEDPSGWGERYYNKKYNQKK